MIKIAFKDIGHARNRNGKYPLNSINRQREQVELRRVIMQLRNASHSLFSIFELISVEQLLPAFFFQSVTRCHKEIHL